MNNLLLNVFPYLKQTIDFFKTSKDSNLDLHYGILPFELLVFFYVTDLIPSLYLLADT